MDDFEKLNDAWKNLVKEIYQTKLFTKIIIPFADWLGKKLK